MRDLEDILRRESQQELPVSPPPGGFQQLREQLQETHTPAGRKWRWLVMLTTFFALVLGVYWWPTGQVTLPGVVAELPSADVPSSLPVPEAVLTTPAVEGTSVIPALPPAKRQAEARRSSPLADLKLPRGDRQAVTSGLSPTAAPVRAPLPPKQAAFGGSMVRNASKKVPRATTFSSEQRSVSGGDSRIDAAAALGKPSDQPKAYAAFPELVVATPPRAIDLPSSTVQLLTSKALAEPINPSGLTTPFRYRKPPITWPSELAGKGWDVSLSHYGQTGESLDRFSLRYADTDLLNPGQPPQAIVIEEETRNLYYVGTEDYEATERVDVVQLRLNRLTAKGLRFGIGLTFYRNGLNAEPAVRTLGETLPNAYLLVYSRKDDYLLGQLSIGYTFLRQKRLQPWLAAGLQVPLWNRFRGETTFLYAGNLNPVSEELRVQNIFGSSIELYPALEAGLQYYLTSRFSAGINLGFVPAADEDIRINPTLGVEARYRW